MRPLSPPRLSFRNSPFLSEESHLQKRAAGHSIHYIELLDVTFVFTNRPVSATPMRDNPAASATVPMKRAAVIAYAWPTVGAAGATACFWAVRGYMDKGQASLLYLPVVLACAVRFGFGPAVLGALLSFLCWDFFLLPPFYTFAVADPKDWLSLIIFLLAATVRRHSGRPLLMCQTLGFWT